ncbi:hypothetical protein G5B00_16480 [Parapedobacter sp. SGR-10]|uniref:hypothetical protein n=1 Tax=Parapedobacter sp. SGR-10 TaxID=2710879 RepID=UPI0013D72F46|nr:hypothetical protein [Parapedobacter sp. SGR-10]NGF58114.1 hypothetical protein [Parapedobacter sp. SGR-10]
MKRLCTLLVAVALLFGCKKENEQKEVSACALQIKEFFKEELKCTEQHSMEINLYAGMYKGMLVYFTMTMCPNCNTVPPSFGYTCANKKIDFDDFTKVSDIQQVYNSCTKRFTEWGVDPNHEE